MVGFPFDPPKMWGTFGGSEDSPAYLKDATSKAGADPPLWLPHLVISTFALVEEQCGPLRLQTEDLDTSSMGPS